MKIRTPIYWDSCIFIRYLTEKPKDFVDDIHRYIEEAKRGEWRIYFSTIIFTEVRPSFFVGNNAGSIAEFIRDMSGAFEPIDPHPNILMMAGAMRDVPTHHPHDDPKATVRVIGTADSIHLASCLYAKEVLGATDIVMHSLDEGRGKNWEGKCVPILGFENWYRPEHKIGPIKSVCDLPRRKPYHPQISLFEERPHAKPIVPA